MIQIRYKEKLFHHDWVAGEVMWFLSSEVFKTQLNKMLSNLG